MLAEKANYTVAFMCRQLQLARSGFYAWSRRRPSARALADRRLVPHLRAVFERARGTYGSPSVHRELRKQGHQVGRHRVARLMRDDGLRARPRRRFVHTTNSRHGHRVAPNILQRRFGPTAANRVWASDITYIPTRKGWLYLAVVLDLHSRRVVGWAAGKSLDQELAINALERAFDDRRPKPGLLHHSDRGTQYASDLYRQLLCRWSARCSMSRKGNCWDNAVVESFFATLKRELVYGADFDDHECAESALFEYIEVFYNRRRRHTTLDYLSPMEYEELAA
jgi:transposase InsO family protein